MDKQTALIVNELTRSNDDCIKLSDRVELLEFECELTRKQRDYWTKRAIDLAFEIAAYKIKGERNV